MLWTRVIHAPPPFGNSTSIAKYTSYVVADIFFILVGGDHIAKLKFGINNEMTFFIVHHVANMNIFFT